MVNSSVNRSEPLGALCVATLAVVRAVRPRVARVQAHVSELGACRHILGGAEHDVHKVAVPVLTKPHVALHVGCLLTAREGGKGGDGAHVERVDEDLPLRRGLLICVHFIATHVRAPVLPPLAFATVTPRRDPLAHVFHDEIPSANGREGAQAPAFALVVEDL
eukprot:scaffold50374_cov63-Phaeocystis_antarctica.AAC.1